MCLKKAGTLHYKHEICYVIMVAMEGDVAIQCFPSMYDEPCFQHNGLIDNNGKLSDKDAIPNFLIKHALALLDDIFIICDVSTGMQRPFVPASFRRAIFDCLHSVSHPGVRATQRMVTSRFVWPHIYSDVRKWARICLHCQRSKVHHHTTTPQATFATPDARFDQVHVDLVGPLPPFNGCVYLL